MSNQADARRLPCAQCGALCCRYMATEIDRPEEDRDYDDIRWYLLHRDVSVFLDRRGSWFLRFATPCEALGEDGRCQCYADRPILCRRHGLPVGTCEFFREPHVVRFDTAEAFGRWLADRESQRAAPRRRRS